MSRLRQFLPATIPLRRWFLGLFLLLPMLVQAQVNANFVANQTSGCSPLTVRFSNLSTGPYDIVFWNLGNGNTSTLTNPVATYVNPGTYSVTLVVTDTASGSASTMTRNAYITVYENPDPDFTVDNTTGCAPFVVNFTDASVSNDGTIVNWEWDFGDGTVGTAQNPSHTYNSAGSYDVTLVVEDDNGCRNSIIYNNLITVTEAANIDFTATPRNGCAAPHTVNFTSSVNPAGTYSYLWNFGDGNTSAATNPTHTYANTGTYTVGLTVTDNNGCSSVEEKIDHVFVDQPVAGFTVANTNVCTGRAVQFINSSVGASSYAWNFGDGNTSTATNPTHTYTVPGTYTITLEAINPGGCSDFEVQTNVVTVNVAPAPAFTANDPVGCQAPMMVNFTDNSTGNIVAWQWNLGNGQTSTARNPIGIYNNPGQYTVSLTVTDANGCQATETIPNYIRLQEPNAEFLMNQTEGCAPLTVNFFDISTSPASAITSWFWNFGDGNFSNQQNPTHTYTTPGLYTVSLMVTTVDGCQNTQLFQFVEVGTPPVVDFTAVPQVACVGEDVNFNDLTTGTGTAWIWDFGDGNGAGVPNPVHQYQDTGVFDVTLIVEYNGCFDTLIRNDFITINGPIAQFVAQPMAGCGPPVDIDFFDQSINATSWSWDFDDGNSSNLENPTHTFTAPGTYDVTLVITDSITGCTDDFIVPVIITNPVAAFTADVTYGCGPMTVNFTNNSTDAVNYFWDFGDGNTSGAANPNHQYTTPGTYTVSLIASDGVCADTLERVNLVRAVGPDPDFTADLFTGCAPLPVTFTDQSTADAGTTITNYLWSFGDGGVSVQQNPTYTYTNPGLYEVSLTVLDSEGCSATRTRSSYINPTFPDANFTSADTVSCPGAFVTFLNQSAGSGLTYLWDFGDGTTSSAVNPTKVYPANATYTVSLTATDLNGCSDTRTRTNFINVGQPTAQFIADQTTATCPPLTVNFTDQSSSNVVSWFWDFGDGSTSSLRNPSKIYATAGSFDVTLVVTTNQGCRDTLEMTNFITIQGPTGSFTFSPTSGCQPLNVNFNVTSPNSNWTYEFFFGDGASAAGTSVTHQYLTDTTATPLMVVEDQFGCRVAITSNDSVEVLPLPDVRFNADQTKICLGQSVAFTNSTTSKASITGFFWDFGDGNTSTAVSPTHVYTDTGTYVVQLQATTSDGCVNTNTIPVTIEVTAPPTATFTVDTNEDCIPFPVNFSEAATGAFTIVDWQWDFGDGDADNGQTIPAHVYDSAGVFTATLTVTDTEGCVGTASRTITANGLPPVDFDAFRYGCAPINVAFSDETLGSSPAVAWSWNFGDGNSSNQQNPTHTYTSDGYYTVSLTVTDANGCVNTLTRTDYIQLERPGANFTSNAGITCPPQTVTFQDLSVPDTTISWRWDFGDGSPPSTQRNPTHTFYGSDTFDVTLIITNIFGCRDTMVRPEHVITYPRPAASFTVSDTAVCVPANLQVSSTSTPSGASLTGYLWDFGTGSGSTTPNASFLYVNPGTYTISLQITDANGCRDTATQQVYINPNPVVDFVAGDTVGCAITTINFVDMTTGTNAPVAWQWSFGDGNVGTSQNPTNTYLADGSYDVTLVATDINGCRDSLTKPNYIVLDHPTADFNVNQSILCPGTTATFTDASTGNFPMVNWIWDFGDGSPLSYQQNPSHVYTTPGTYDVTLVVTDGITCRDTITKTTYINVYTSPTASFTYTPPLGCDPLTVNFTDASANGTGTIVNYDWDFGDGGSSVLADPTYVYSAPGLYTVTLTVTDNNGCSDVYTQTVRVLEIPVADFTADRRVGCAPEAINFSDLTTTPYVKTAWRWDFGDGNTSTLRNPTHTYLADGVYDVKLVVTDQNGCQDSITKASYIRLSHPVADFTYDNSLVCPNEPIGVTFTDTSVPDTTLISWSWNFGDGTTATAQNPSHSYASSGTYTVSLQVTNILGCTAQDTQVNVITVRNPPVPAFAMSDSVNCTPLSIAFTDQTVAGDGTLVDWKWYFGNGDSSSVRNATYTWTTPGIYTVTLQTTDANGCIASTNKTVRARELPVANFFSPDTLGCAPRTVRFTNTSTASATITYWKWFFGDGDSLEMAANPVHTYDADGVYDVTLIIGDQFGCRDTITRSNYIRLSHPVADFTTDLSLVCPGVPVGVTFTDTSIPDTTITNWAWRFGDGSFSTLQSPSHSYTTPGVYSVQLIVTNILGCRDTLEVANNVTVLTPPNVAFAVSDSADCNPHAVTFTDLSTPGDAALVAWNWDFGNGNTSLVQNPAQTYTTPGTYTVSLRVEDANGCATTASRNLRSLQLPVANFEASDTVGCAPQAITFSDLSTNGAGAINAWLWDFGDGNTSTLRNPTHTYLADGSYTVSLTVTDVNGCTHTFTRPEYIELTHPTAALSLSTTQICPGTIVTFLDQSTPDHPIVGWDWDFGDGNTATSQNAAHVYHTPGLYTVRLVITNVLGCTDTIVHPTPIRVYTPPTAITTPGDTTNCTPFLVNFEDASTPGDFALTGWTWDFANGNSSTLANPAVQTYTTPGTYPVELIVTDAFGCRDTAVANVTVNDQPTADFFANRTVGCPPSIIRFTDVSTGSAVPVAWFWDFGDGNTSTQRSPQHTYTSNGTYDVTLVVTDANGCMDTLTRSQYIRMRDPEANFTMSATTICPGTQVAFTDLSVADTTISSWRWNFGDGGISNAQNPTHIYTAAGSYTVQLVVTTVLGCVDTLEQVNVITVNTKPDAAFTVNDPDGCAPFRANFSNTSSANSQPIVSWNWNFGNGVTSTLAQRNVTYANPGTYTVTLVATDALGCTDTATGTIRVFENPITDFVASDSVGCAPTDITFFDQTQASAVLNFWQWNFGNGTSSNSPVPVATYANDGVYDVSLIVGDVNGCRDTLTKVQYIRLTHPVADFDASDREVCPGTPIQFLDNSTPDTTLMSWAWTFGDGTTSNSPNPVKTYNTPGVYEVSLTVTNVLNCSDTETKTAYITVLNPPTAAFFASDTVGCAPLAIGLSDQSSGNPAPVVSYRWDFGNGDTSILRNPSVQYKFAGTYTISLEVTDSKGCTNVATRQVRAVNGPTADFIASDTVGCAQAISFFDLSSGDGNIIAWKWHFGDGDSAMTQNPTHSYQSTGTYTVSLAVVDEFGCTDTLVKPDYIDLTRPQAAFIQDNDEVCPGTFVQFRDVSTPDYPIVDWTWDFGDGNTGSGPTPMHAFYTPGTYTVRLTITNTLGCQDVAEGLVTVLDPPIASFSPSTNDGCEPLTVEFTNNSTSFSAPLILYEWSFGDGNFSTDINPQHIYDNPGTYSVILRVMDGNGCLDDTTMIVEVRPLPNVDFTANTTVGCAPEAINFTQLAGGTNPIVGYQWDFGDGNTSNAPNPTHTYASDGLYTVTLTVTDIYGCVSSLTKTEYIRLRHPVADFSWNPAVGCPGTTVRLRDRSVEDTTLVSWRWDLGNGQTANTQNVNHIYHQPGTYSVELIVTNLLGCSDTIRQNDIITIYQQPVAAFTPTDSTGCTPFSLPFRNASAGTSAALASYQWNFGDGTVSTLPNPNHTFTTAGAYNVSLITTDANGCRDTALHTINSLELPQPEFTSSDRIGCSPKSVSFVDQSVASAPIVDWRWNFGDGGGAVVPFPNHLYTADGEYDVSLQVTDAVGCQNTLTKPRYVRLNHPEADFSVNMTEICPGTSVAFSDQTLEDTTIVSWFWDFGDGTTSTQPNPTKVYSAPGNYTVTLTVENVLGCGDVMTKNNFVEVLQRPQADFDPSAFSGCSPLSVSFTNTTVPTSGPITAYAWDFDNGSTSAFANPSTVFTSPGQYPVRLIATDSYGCRDTVVKPITVFVSPTAGFQATDTVGCAPVNVQFLDLSDPGDAPIQSWTWTFGDGNSATTQFPSHTYPNDGTYDVSLIVVDANGCADTAARAPYIRLSHPVAEFDKSANQICPGTVVSFTDRSIEDTTIVAWSWDFGDGGSSSAQNPTHLYQTGGTYDVTLTVTNLLGCSHSITKPNFVEVLAGPTTQFSPSLPQGCTPFNVTFTDLSVGVSAPVVAWSWDFGDGGSSTAQNPTYSYPTPGIYDVTLTTTDNRGCVSSFTRQVEALTMPVADFLSTDTVGCAPSSVYFKDLTLGDYPIIDWKWDFGDGNSSNQQFPTHTYQNDGRYTVSLVAMDLNGCRDTVTKVEYIRLSNPRPDFTLDTPQGCPGVTVNFTDLSIGDTTLVGWLWNFGDGTTSIVRNPSHTYNHPGLYTVTLTVTNANGCSKTLTMPNAVRVTTPPVAAFTLADSISCAPFTLDITDVTQTVSAPVVAWRWNFGDGNSSAQQEPVYTYNQAGTYELRFHVTDDFGCVDSTSKTVIATSPPTARFVVDDSLGCAPFTATFADRSVGAYPATGWLWSFGDGNTSTAQNPVHTYTQDGIYTVSLIIFDDNGCSDTIVKPDLIRLSHPVADFRADVLNGCQGTTVNFTDLSVGDTTLTGWFWDFGNGTQTVVQSPSHTYSNSGRYDVTLIVTNILGCRDTARRTNLIDIFEMPEALFTASDTADCYPFQADFNDFSSSRYGLSNWEWYVNGQRRSISQNFSFFFDTVGVYNVKLVVTDNNGCQDSMMQRVYRYGIPEVDFLASDTLGCAPEAITFLDQSYPTPVTWEWAFGDGGTSTQQNPVHTYQEDGIYTVSLRITDINGCSDEHIKVNYIVLDHPTIDFVADYESGCPPLPVTFRASGSGLVGFANWRWDFGDGRVTTSLVDSITYAYPAPGDYEVTLTVTDSLGCQASLSKPNLVSVLGDIIPDPIRLYNVTVLDDQQVRLTWAPHNDEDFLKYTIYREEPGVGYQQVFETFYINDTTWIEDGLVTTDNSYCYKVTVTNFCGTESDLNLTRNHCTIDVTATPTPGQILVDWNPYVGWQAVAQYEVYRVRSYNPQDAEFIGVVPGTVTEFSEEIEDCFNDYFYRVQAIGPGPLQESWSDTALAVNFHGTVGRATQLVRATVENNQHVLVEWKDFELPGAEFVYVERQYDNTAWSTIAVISPDELNYLDVDVDVNTTSYSYRVSAQDSCGNYTPLSNIGKTVVAKAEKDGATPLIRWTPYEEWTYGVDRYRIEIFLDTTGRWEVVDVVNGDVHEYYDTQTSFDQAEYCYRVIAIERAGNRAESVSNETCVDVLSNIRVPNAFTPNRDGINEVWKPEGLHIQTYHLQIFSRWGMKLFESYDPHVGWDGTYQGQQVKEGVYTFVIEGTSYNGAPFLQKGTITLMR